MFKRLNQNFMLIRITLVFNKGIENPYYTLRGIMQFQVLWHKRERYRVYYDRNRANKTGLWYSPVNDRPSSANSTVLKPSGLYCHRAQPTLRLHRRTCSLVLLLCSCHWASKLAPDGWTCIVKTYLHVNLLPKMWFSSPGARVILNLAPS